MQPRQEAVLNFVSYAGSRAVALAVFGTSVPLALQSLGQERYAVLATFILALGLLPMLDAGLGYALAFRYSRQALRETPRRERILGEHSAAFLGVGLVLGLVFAIGFPMILGPSGRAIPGMAVAAVGGGAAVVFSTASTVGRVVLTGHRRAHEVNFLDMGTDVLRGLALIVGAWFLASIAWTAVLSAGAYLARWIAVLFICRHVSPQRSGSILPVRWQSVRATLRLGAPFALSTAAAVSWGLIDKAMIARTFSLQDLAPYSLAYDLVTKGWMVIWAVSNAIAPILMRWHHAREHEKIRRAHRYSWILVVGLAVMTYLPLNLFEKPLLGWWVGAAMADASREYIAYLSVASVVYFGVSTMQTFFLFRGRPGVVARAYFIGLAAYLACLVYGLERWQVLGAAVAHIVLWLTIAITMALSLRQVTGSPIVEGQDNAAAL